jgi:nucleotide-binding universal stress UspA family protein
MRRSDTMARSSDPGGSRFKPFAIKTASRSRSRAAEGRIRTILVPVDFSDCSLAGLKYALKFAKEFGARLIVLHITDLGPVMMTTACGDYDSPAYLEAARRRCDDRMRAFLKRVHKDGVPVETLALAGYCPAAIYEAAVKKAVDLIILSTHGRTGLRRAFIGSIAEGTVRHAACPVLVVPSFSHASTRGGKRNRASARPAIPGKNSFTSRAQYEQ